MAFHWRAVDVLFLSISCILGLGVNQRTSPLPVFEKHCSTVHCEVIFLQELHIVLPQRDFLMVSFVSVNHVPTCVECRRLKVIVHGSCNRG